MFNCLRKGDVDDNIQPVVHDEHFAIRNEETFLQDFPGNFEAFASKLP